MRREGVGGGEGESRRGEGGREEGRGEEGGREGGWRDWHPQPEMAVPEKVQGWGDLRVHGHSPFDERPGDVGSMHLRLGQAEHQAKVNGLGSLLDRAP